MTSCTDQTPPINEICTGTIETSEPIVVRPADVGGTDHSEFSRYASDAKALSTSKGILVTWNMGVNGQSPEPNGYVRLLDDDAHPKGGMELPFDQSMVFQASSLVGTKKGAVLTFCGLYPDGSDHITSVLLDSSGHFISEQRRFSTNHLSCGASSAQAIWTGSHLMFAWTLQAYGATGAINDVLLDVTDTNGNSLFESTVRSDGETEPHFAVGHGYVMMAVTTRTGLDLATQNRGQSHVAVHRFDLEGYEIGEGIILEPVPFDAEGRTILGEFGSAFMVPTVDGWLLVTSSRALGYYIAHFAPDGTLLSGPELMDADRNYHNGFEDVIPYGDGAVVLSSGSVFFLSEDGTIRQEWQSNQDESLGRGSLVEHKGRLFVVYTSVGQGRPLTNQVLIRELQCVQ